MLENCQWQRIQVVTATANSRHSTRKRTRPVMAPSCRTSSVNRPTKALNIIAFCASARRGAGQGTYAGDSSSWRGGGSRFHGTCLLLLPTQEVSARRDLAHRDRACACSGEQQRARRKRKARCCWQRGPSSNIPSCCHSAAHRRRPRRSRPARRAGPAAARPAGTGARKRGARSSAGRPWLSGHPLMGWRAGPPPCQLQPPGRPRGS